ncbi:hypothetical protein PIB30_077724 [Stylosanthes scabra]|uniref:Serine-threonine/tyrosine-protein kinase catalytic domain-containing protein n=1 Tax=Stylosanthes scabra TaxID=79078 RepID=A0ABU6XPK4_9FABA|nr:hypothetical protein [Stylosanthes scabra]
MEVAKKGERNYAKKSLEANYAACAYTSMKLKKATEQIDVYSFGVVLLELVSGRQAEKADSSESIIDIVKWVRRKVNIANGVQQILEKRMSSTCHQEIVRALDIALRCTSVVAKKRPSMVEVVKSLQSLELRTCIVDLQDQLPNEELSNIPI